MAKSSKTNGKKKEQVSKLQDIDKIISEINYSKIPRRDNFKIRAEIGK